jgi:hypothetical protein
MRGQLNQGKSRFIREGSSEKLNSKERGRAVLILQGGLRLPAVGTLKRYSKALEYEYRVKTAALGTLERYSILSLTLYLE